MDAPNISQLHMQFNKVDDDFIYLYSVVKEDDAIEDLHVAPYAEGKRRDEAQQGKADVAQDRSADAFHVPFVLQIGDADFQQRHRTRQRGHEQAHVKENHEEPAKRNLREDKRNGHKYEPGACIGILAHGEHGGHDHETGEKRCLNGEVGDPQRGVGNVGGVLQIGTVCHHDAAP